MQIVLIVLCLQHGCCQNTLLVSLLLYNLTMLIEGGSGGQKWHVFCLYSKRSSKGIHYATITVKPQERGGGEEGNYPREIDIQGCPMGRDFEHTRCPNYLTSREKVTLGADIWHSLVVRGVGNLTLASLKMSNSPGSATTPPPTSSWGLTLIGALHQRNWSVVKWTTDYKVFTCLQLGAKRRLDSLDEGHLL